MIRYKYEYLMTLWDQIVIFLNSAGLLSIFSYLRDSSERIGLKVV